MVYFLWVMFMARSARKTSISNIYHVMLRGVNRQTIFEDDGDRHYFMTVLKYYKEISGFMLHAFCLMSNHVHLLIEPANEPLDIVFRKLGAKYVSWYNKKYQRVGHLFQDRFRSENVETDQYFMTVLRYIIQNPMKAGLETRPGSYRWSSYLAYEKGLGAVTDTQYAISLFGDRETLTDYLQQSNEDAAMDEADCDRYLRDELAKRIMERITQCSSISDFQKFDLSIQKEFARKMYIENLSMGQISRLTGMSKTTISRAVKKQFPAYPTQENSLVLHDGIDLFRFETEEIW